MKQLNINIYLNLIIRYDVFGNLSNSLKYLGNGF